MRFTSPSRRALGLLAASTIGMSTAVLGVAGVASAVPLGPVTSDDSVAASTPDGEMSLTIPDGYCTAFLQVTGAQGGGQDSSSSVGGQPETIEVYLSVSAGQEFVFAAGGAGGASNPGDGAAGQNPGLPSADGGAGSAAGGGGAGSAVLLDGTPLATARGGDGADATPDTTGGAGGGTSGVAGSATLLTGRDPEILPETDWTGDGAVSISAQGCEAPYAPSIDSLAAGDGQATVSFFAESGDEYTAAPSGYEYTVNGTTWTALTGAQVTAEEFTVPDLTNGTSYAVSMRSTSDSNGTSEVSEAGTVTPYAPIGSATITSVRSAPTALTVDWTAPTTIGTYPLGGYEVYVSAAGNGGNACTAPATATSCTFAVDAGLDYRVVVVAVDSEGHADPEGSAPAMSGVVPAPTVPSSVPTQDDGDIVGPAGPITSVTAGQKITVQGSGFLPFSTVQLTVFSAPVSLGTVVTDENGAFSVEVTLPADLADGTHTLAATGIAPDGTARNLVVTVTVSGGNAVVTNAALATTGFDTAVPLTGGALAVLAGAGLLVGARRRTTA